VSAWPFAVLAGAWVALDLERLRLVERVLARRAPAPRAGPVAVLQAIRGGDPTLSESLAANLDELARAGHEIWWLLDEDDVRGRRSAEEALLRVPAGRARVSLHPSPPAGVNPKLFKLARAVTEVEREVVVVLDDDARLPRASLDALVAALPPGELVVATALPAYLDGGTLAARLLAAFVNDHAALTYLPWTARRAPLSLNGMAWATRRESLRALGGFAPLLRHLADDLAVARACLARGGRIEQLAAPVWMRTELDRVPAYARQMHRWMLFAWLLVEAQPWRTRGRLFLSQGLPALFLPGLATLLCFRPSLRAVFVLGLAFALHLVVCRRARARASGAASPSRPLASLVVALLQPVFLAWSAFDRRICWRDRRYRVHTNEHFTGL
jgi:ceramide glucosyltransferase